ncbi:MAG: DNA-binding response regulator [Lutibacter sp.]|nr:MAG: DNA-binding response regulator [Lutibacter sp.]
MAQPIKIFIVEDEMIIAANISLQLTDLGYEVTGIVPRGEDALIHVQENKPDIVLIDINLKGNIDGIETVELMQKDYSIPVIYLTANADEEHFNRAKKTNPQAFISKPFKKLDLQRAIELTVNRLQANQGILEVEEDNSTSFILSDCIFVKHHEKMVKIVIEDILYIEADRNYSCIHSKGKDYLLVTTLKNIDMKLPAAHFMRVHRSFIVNISQIDEVGSTHIVIAKKAIPISKHLRGDLMKRFQTI